MVPSMAVGACLGRVLGLCLSLVQESVGDVGFFAECAGHDPCITPGHVPCLTQVTYPASPGHDPAVRYSRSRTQARGELWRGRGLGSGRDSLEPVEGRDSRSRRRARLWVREEEEGPGVGVCVLEGPGVGVCMLEDRGLTGCKTCGACCITCEEVV
jgi:hypothetical protein